LDSFCFSYLAEAHLACKEKFQDLLGYMLYIEGEDEQRYLQDNYGQKKFLYSGAFA